MRQFLAFLEKEFYHIFRDVRTMMILLLMPIILIVLFGYAITTEIRQVPIAILDNSKDELSQKTINRILANEYFTLYESVEQTDDIHTLFKKGKIKMAVVIPAQFAENTDSQVQLLIDATDPNEATQLSSYASAIIAEQLISDKRVAIETQTAGLTPTQAQITPIVHLLYNPMMKGAYNFVPGVMGMILMLICALMTSVGIVREKETGTMEILLVSPLKPIYIILAKAAPYLLLSIINIATILFLSYFLLGVPINGSLWLLVGISILYTLLSLCLGLLISTVTATQQAAMLISAMVLMLPVILLSGMMFPIENMPLVLQWLSNIVPAKWYIIAVKDVMIKGLPASAILKEIGILAFMTLFLIIVSVKRFDIRLK